MPAAAVVLVKTDRHAMEYDGTRLGIVYYTMYAKNTTLPQLGISLL